MSYYDRFFKKNGDLTAYSLACGYKQNVLSPDGKSDVELYGEHGVYHVRAYNRDGALLRLSWETFRKLTDARAQYRALVRAISQPW